MKVIKIIIRIFLTLLFVAIALPLTLVLVRKFFEKVSRGTLFGCDYLQLPTLEAPVCNRNMEGFIMISVMVILAIGYYVLFSKLLGRFLK